MSGHIATEERHRYPFVRTVNIRFGRMHLNSICRFDLDYLLLG